MDEKICDKVHPKLILDLGANCTGLKIMIAQKDNSDAAGHVSSAR